MLGLPPISKPRLGRLSYTESFRLAPTIIGITINLHKKTHTKYKHTHTHTNVAIVSHVERILIIILGAAPSRAVIKQQYYKACDGGGRVVGRTKE